MSNTNVNNKTISTTIQEKWQNIVDIIAEITGSSDALITKVDYPNLEVFKASNNKENIFKEGMSAKLSGHYCETVIQSHKKLKVVNASKNSKWKNSIGDQAGFKAYLGYPLKWPDGNIFGTLCIHYRKEHEFSSLTQKIMSQFKDLIESHLQIIDDNNIMKENNRILKQQKIEITASFEQLTAYNQEVIAMNEELEQSFEEVNKLNKRFDKLQTNFTKELTTSVVKIMEMYDLYTKGHSESVAELASVIAKEMGLSRKTIKNTYWAGLVHDIGKLLIPIEIINKTEKLTENEFDLIKKHPVWGNKAFSDSKTLQPLAKHLLYHHERWDGKGYPEGLKEDQIPLISQILSVADAWDAMLSKRPYRKPLSFEKALAEIKNNRGTQFSPEVVDTFIKIVENNKIEELKIDVLENEINTMKITDINIVEKEESYKKLAESVKAILWEYDIKTDNWDYVSPQSETILGYKPVEWIDLDFWTAHLHPEDRDSAKSYCLDCTAQGKDHVLEYRFRKSDGEYLWIRDEVMVVMSANEAVKIRGFMIDITKIKKMENEIRELSYRDHLTGLYNRRYLDQQVDELKDSDNYPLSFIIGDIDDLKMVNDKYGHSMGDYYIQKTADVFRNVLRTTDIIARTGGDEFAVLLPKTTYKTTANICDRIQERLTGINKKDKLPQIFSISLGCSTALSKRDDLNRIYEKSDQAMYKIKRVK